jgi:hypothetical protein
MIEILCYTVNYVSREILKSVFVTRKKGPNFGNCKIDFWVLSILSCTDWVQARCDVYYFGPSIADQVGTDTKFVCVSLIWKRTQCSTLPMIPISTATMMMMMMMMVSEGFWMEIIFAK